jgi:hypothetical protein
MSVFTGITHKITYPNKAIEHDRQREIALLQADDLMDVAKDLDRKGTAS